MCERESGQIVGNLTYDNTSSTTLPLAASVISVPIASVTVLISVTVRLYRKGDSGDHSCGSGMSKATTAVPSPLASAVPTATVVPGADSTVTLIERPAGVAVAVALAMMVATVIAVRLASIDSSEMYCSGTCSSHTCQRQQTTLTL